MFWNWLLAQNFEPFLLWQCGSQMGWGSPGCTIARSTTPTNIHISNLRLICWSIMTCIQNSFFLKELMLFPHMPTACTTHHNKVRSECRAEFAYMQSADAGYKIRRVVRRRCANWPPVRKQASKKRHRHLKSLTHGRPSPNVPTIGPGAVDADAST